MQIPAFPGGGVTSPATSVADTVQQQGSASEGDREQQALRNACAELESLFIFHLLKEMRATVPQEGLLHGGPGEEIFTSLMDGEMARAMAIQRGVGLARMLEAQLTGHLAPVAAEPPAPPASQVIKGYRP
jgi:Rod binding domain-containing protein